MRIQRRFIPWVAYHLLEFWKFYIFAVLALIGLQISQAKIPELAKNLGDQILGEGVGSQKVLSFFFLALSIFILRTLSRWLFFYPARVQQKSLRLELIELIGKANPKDFKDYSVGEIYQILFNDFNRLRGFIGFALLQFANMIIASFVLIPKINEIHPGILITFIPMVISIIIFSGVIFFFQPILKRGIKIQGSVQNIILEAFDAKKTIASFQKESAFIKRFEDKSALELDTFFKASIGSVLARPLVPLGVSISLLWGAYLIQGYGLKSTYLIMFSGFLYLVLEPLMFLSWIGIVTSEALAGWSRIKGFLSVLIPLNVKKKELPSTLVIKTKFWGHEILIEQERNTILGVFGETGCGKSTFLKNIADKLILNGYEISMVMQEPHLFDDTLLNNVALGKSYLDTDFARLDRLLKIFGLDTLAPNPLNLELGENGKRLSGGQIKRLCLVRSLMSNADYLIWDDPFSSVDNIIESEILTLLKDEGYLENKFLLLSSHRITTFKFVTNLIHLKKTGEVRFLETIKNDKEANEFFESQMVELS